jgi:hypothetical protein
VSLAVNCVDTSLGLETGLADNTMSEVMAKFLALAFVATGLKNVTVYSRHSPPSFHQVEHMFDKDLIYVK